MSGSIRGDVDMTGLGAADHRGLEVLSMDECQQLIDRAAVGRIAFVTKGGPLVLPVTHRLVGNAVVFRTSHGEKLDAAGRNAPAAFEVDDWDAASRTGWSVVVRGDLELVDDPDERAQLDDLDLEPWAAPKFRTAWVKLRLGEVTGRRLG